MKKVDARGLSCPTPLIMTIQALKLENEFDVIIDDEVARENILRMLKDKHGIEPALDKSGEEITIHVKK